VPTDIFGGLSGTARDAATAAYSVLEAYGLGSLASALVRFVQLGFSGDTLMIELQQTTEWKHRFEGNEIRAQKGYSVLSPADYINTENAYRQLMIDANFPPGFYDQPSDYAKAIGNDLSPQNMQRRIAARKAVFDSQNTAAADYMTTHYGITAAGSFANFIDPGRALPLLEKQSQAAVIGGAAAVTGFGDVLTSTAERLAGRGLTEEQALTGFGDVAALKGLTVQLPGQRGQLVTAEDLIGAEFDQNAQAQQAIKRVEGARTADFGEGGGGYVTTKAGATGLRTADK
jgi:hypothetical protein